MAKINLEQKILDLEGEPIKLGDKDITFGRAIALCLVSGNKSSDPMRAYILAQSFLKEDTKEVDLNQSDMDFIKSAIKSADNYTDIVKGQLLIALK